MRNDPVPGWPLCRDRPTLHGAMGTVSFAMEAARPSRSAVIKRPKAELLRGLAAPDRLDALSRFREEVEIQRCVTHLFAPIVYDVGEAVFSDHDEFPIPYVVMEDLSGHVELGPGKVREALQLLVGTLQALHVLAALRGPTVAFDAMTTAKLIGLEHRDIKLDNVWLLPSGRVVLMDFGLARWTNDRRPSVRFSRGGTPSMMAPEALDLRVARPTDCRADLYSVGAMVWEALTGSAPYPGRTDQDILDAMRRTSSIVLNAPGLTDTLGAHAAAAVRDVLMGLLEKDVILRTATPWDALEALAASGELRTLLGTDPCSMPFDAQLLERGDLDTQLRALAVAEPSPTLTQILTSIRDTEPGVFHAQLLGWWVAGALRSGRKTIRVNWAALRDPSWDPTRLEGALAPAASVAAALDAALAANDDDAIVRAFTMHGSVRVDDLHDVLTAWADLRGIAHPTVTVHRALLAERAGDTAAAYALLRQLPATDAIELRTRLAVTLGLPEARDLVATLPDTPAGVLTKAEYLILNGPVHEVLTVTDTLSPDTDRETLLSIMNLRLRAALYLFRKVRSKDSAAGAAEEAVLERELARLHDLHIPEHDYSPSLVVTLGMIAGIAGRIDDMVTQFSSVRGRLRADPSAAADIYRMEETAYDVLRAAWREGKNHTPETRRDLLTYASNALGAAEKLRNPTRLINALTNEADCRALHLVDSEIKSLTLVEGKIDEPLATVRSCVAAIRAAVGRAHILLGGAPYEHDLALRSADRIADAADLITRIFEDLRWFAQQDEGVSGKSLPALTSLKNHLLATLEGKAGATSEALQLSLEILGLITRSNDLDTALRTTLDRLIEHFQADWGRIDWGPIGCTPSTITYRYGRRKDGTDFASEPQSSMTLKEQFLAAPDGLILQSDSPEILNSESVLLMGADCFLGVALCPFGPPRGVLMLVVKTVQNTTPFGDSSRDLLKAVADTIAVQLAFREKDDMLRSATTGGLMRVISEEIHTLKNDVKAAAEMFQEADSVRAKELDPALESEDVDAALNALGSLTGLLATIQKHVVAARDLANHIMSELRLSTRALPNNQPDTDDPASVLIAEGAKPGAASRLTLGEPNDITRLLTEFCGMARERVRAERIGVTYASVLTEIPLVRYDSSIVNQLLENLFNNSIYYLRTTVDRPRQFTITVDATETHLVVVVADTGPGMTQFVLNHVILGASTKGGEGTGLGIPSVLSAMKHHWGSTQIDTQRGVGTTFTLSFPLGPPASDDAFEAMLITEDVSKSEPPSLEDVFSEHPSLLLRVPAQGKSLRLHVLQRRTLCQCRRAARRNPPGSGSHRRAWRRRASSTSSSANACLSGSPGSDSRASSTAQVTPTSTSKTTTGSIRRPPSRSSAISRCSTRSRARTTGPFPSSSGRMGSSAVSSLATTRSCSRASSCSTSSSQGAGRMASQSSRACA